VAEPPVVDASPLLVLSRTGRLDLLRLLGDSVIVPAAVAEEVRSHSDEASRALDSEAWLDVRIGVPIAETILAWDLGSGESAVLSWALTHPGSVAVIDDYAARKCGEVLGLPVRGTLGLALLGKQRGHFESAREVVEDLRRGGLYLADELVERALRLVGE
jgi:predicted nucleic acid-binding protein